jgi:RimJ/RimL family protein N-acetyltransferase
MDKSDYNCRRTIKEDLSFWREVYSDPIVKKYFALWGEALTNSKEFWEYLNLCNRYVVINSQNEIIGGFTIYNKKNKKAEFGIVLHPNFKNKKLGSVLMFYLESTAKSFGIKNLKAEVYEENLACLTLLKKHGFKDIIFLEKNI